VKSNATRAEDMLDEMMADLPVKASESPEPPKVTA